MSKSTFSGYERAKWGCIVTFRLPDDTIHVKHFSTIIREQNRHGKNGPRVTFRDQQYVAQAVDWADQHDATIISISTPETILRDLQGTRAKLQPQRTGHPDGRRGGMQLHPEDAVRFPERWMLKKRGDLFEVPGGRSA